MTEVEGKSILVRVSEGSSYQESTVVGESRDGAVVRALASHRKWPGFDSRSLRHMWVAFVVSCRPCFEDSYPGFVPPRKPTLINSNSIPNTP